MISKGILREEIGDQLEDWLDVEVMPCWKWMVQRQRYHGR